jgi:hypothetical protein
MVVEVTTLFSMRYLAMNPIHNFRFFFEANARRSEVDHIQAIDNTKDKPEVVISAF